jgi:2-polyprenyl-6-methoxyphenol hydroxylase-like FAD-dependent oxidoreductase
MPRAIIVGAGPGGLSAAIALRRAGFETEVCEAAGELREVGSGLTLWPNALRALEFLGLGEALRANALPFDGIAMRRWNGELIFQVSAATEGLGWSVALHRAELQSLLVGAVGASSIRLNARCVGVEDSGTTASVVLETGERLAGDVVIGADGLHSRVRCALIGPEPPRRAGYRVWRGVADYELSDRIGVTFLGRGAQFGMLPMSGGRVYWFASLNTDPEEPVPVSAQAHLDPVFGDACHPIPEIIKATKDDSIVCTDIYDRKPLKRWSYGRVTLLGDAAHPSVPTLGQGACQAIEDAASLGNCLQGGDDIPAALLDYQERRVRRANAMIKDAWRIGQVGQWRNAIACHVRDWLIKAMPTSLRRSQLRSMFEFQL